MTHPFDELSESLSKIKEYGNLELAIEILGGNATPTAGGGWSWSATVGARSFGPIPE